jgi:hypothetical protein
MFTHSHILAALTHFSGSCPTFCQPACVPLVRKKRYIQTDARILYDTPIIPEFRDKRIKKPAMRILNPSRGVGNIFTQKNSVILDKMTEINLIG